MASWPPTSTDRVRTAWACPLSVPDVASVVCGKPPITGRSLTAVSSSGISARTKSLRALEEVHHIVDGACRFDLAQHLLECRANLLFRQDVVHQVEQLGIVARQDLRMVEQAAERRHTVGREETTQSWQTSRPRSYGTMRKRGSAIPRYIA